MQDLNDAPSIFIIQNLIGTMYMPLKPKALIQIMKILKVFLKCGARVVWAPFVFSGHKGKIRGI